LTFFALGFLFLFVLFIIAKEYPPLPEETFLLKQLTDKGPTVEALTVGNSLNGSLNLEKFCFNGYQFYDGCTDFFELEYKLDHLCLISRVGCRMASK